MRLSVRYLINTKSTHNLVHVSIYNTKPARNPQNYQQRVNFGRRVCEYHCHP